MSEGYTDPVELIKAEVYFIKFEGEDISNRQALEDQLNMALDRNHQEVSVHVGECKTVKINWHDDIDINSKIATPETYNKYFKSHAEKRKEEIVWADPFNDKVWRVGDTYWIYNFSVRLMGTIVGVDKDLGCLVEWNDGTHTTEGTPEPATDWWKAFGRSIMH